MYAYDKLIKENPKEFIYNCKCELDNIKRNVNIVGFGRRCSGFHINYEELEKIVNDGPRKLSKNIHDLFPFPKSAFWFITQDDYVLFEKEYAKASKKIQRINDAIKYAESFMQNNSLNQNEEKTM